MTWMHIAALAIGAGVGVVGALTPAGSVLMPLATAIIGGVLGHAAQPANKQ